MTAKQQEIIRALEAAAVRHHLEHHLAAVRHLASDEGLSVDQIEAMMRGMYSRRDIRALIAEAHHTNTIHRAVNTTAMYGARSRPANIKRSG